MQKKKSARYYPIYYDSKTGKLSATSKLEIEILPLDSNDQKRIWRKDKGDIDEMFEHENLFIKKTKYGYQVYFKFRGGLSGETPKSFWNDPLYSASEHGTQILDKILGRRESFNFPKSPFAVADCIRIASNKKNSIILDFFAGSGTTAQAVLELNKNDGGNRKFILCTNNENDICKNICYPRVKKIIKGYTNFKNEKVSGFGGNLKYFKTDFVDAEPTDRNKKYLVDQSTEMLCLKENCFDKIKFSKFFKIFSNDEKKYLAIIYDDGGIEPFKTELLKLRTKVNTYIFSLDESAREEEFEDVQDLVDLKPIPEVILNVYRRIFR